MVRFCRGIIEELEKLNEVERFFYEFKRGENLTISNIEELKFLSKSPKVKRFWFWLGRPNFANPQVYLFELKNNSATKKTDLLTFIKNAKLTFFKEGWIII